MSISKQHTITPIS